MFRRKKVRSERTRALRIFFATDVHGSDRCFRKFLAAATVYEADVLVLGGDVAGKGLIPLRAENGAIHATIHGAPVTVPAHEEARLRADINRMGLYSPRMDEYEIARVEADGSQLEALFRREITDQLKRWCDLAAERLAPEVRCIITPGNDDPLEIDEVLRAAPRVECPERELCDLGVAVLASLGDVTPTPWNTEREYTENELGERVATLLDDVPSDRRLILNFHCPPFESGLDAAPELNETLKPVFRGGAPSLVPVGSKAIRAAIVEYQPAVGLHGHIHESRGVQKIGQTLCINPGSEYSSDVLLGAVVDLADDGSLVDYLLTSG
jgi:uncharacterized protein